MIKYLFSFTCLMLFLSACGDNVATPKPRAYPKVEFPERSYLLYDTISCPYTFRFPAYGEIIDKKEKCWFDIYMPAFNARLHCSYVPLTDKEGYHELVQDAFVIARKINERANYMEESRIKNINGVGGLLLNWTGPAASPVHFFLSDTSHHFFKAALYFDSKVQPDSLAPMITFIKQDLDTLIASFAWKEVAGQ